MIWSFENLNRFRNATIQRHYSLVRHRMCIRYYGTLLTEKTCSESIWSRLASGSSISTNTRSKRDSNAGDIFKFSAIVLVRLPTVSILANERMDIMATDLYLPPDGFAATKTVVRADSEQHIPAYIL